MQRTNISETPKTLSMETQFAQLTAARVSKHRLPPDLMPSAADFAAMVISSSSKGYVEIFNPDRKRSQKKLRKNSRLLKVIASALERVLQLNENGRGLKIGNAFMLCSEKNCKAQPYHVDYDPLKLHGLTQKPYGVLFAVEQNTQFWCYIEGQEHHLKLNQGEFVVFDGDLIHAGAAYADTNKRIHLYVDVEGVDVADETFLVNVDMYEQYLLLERKTPGN
jgi:hypothetical protein